MFASCVILLTVGSSVWGWWSGGHGILTQAAVKAMPESVPEFFRSGERMVAHCSYDPDIAKNRGTPYVRGAEHPEHYLDLELLEGKPLPKSRYEFTQLCAELGTGPEKIGLLPYALAEWTERLAVAFAEHRKWPDNPFIQNKCLVYAGFIAHYAQDMCQPLHLTVHFNGRKQPDGSVLHKGIHEKVDALIEYLKLDPGELARDQQVEPLNDLMGDILSQFETVYAMVNRVYELADSLPSTRGEDWTPVSDVVDFVTERARESVRFTAALYLTAWEASEEIRLPGWLDRAQTDGEASR
ncbi:MAG: hypothetical protein O7E52_00710 [Candidatus Poribacteria bacterium]|nr:hypothetical protein [Candidatus Poribacteria bacterium]